MRRRNSYSARSSLRRRFRTSLSAFVSPAPPRCWCWSHRKPAVVGAAIDLGPCLDLTTAAGVAQLKIAYDELLSTSAKAKFELPQNHSDGLRRNLDCAVIEMFHRIRRDAGEAPVDTVRGIFIEGERIYLTGVLPENSRSDLRCNPDTIKGAFRVPDSQLRRS